MNYYERIYTLLIEETKKKATLPAGLGNSGPWIKA